MIFLTHVDFQLGFSVLDKEKVKQTPHKTTMKTYQNK